MDAGNAVQCIVRLDYETTIRDPHAREGVVSHTRAAASVAYRTFWMHLCHTIVEDIFYEDQVHIWVNPLVHTHDHVRSWGARYGSVTCRDIE